MKKIKLKLKLFLSPKNAKPSPPVGPLLGQYGINLIEFCNKFNSLSKDIVFDKISTKIIVYEDNSFDIILGTLSVTDNVKMLTKIEKFSKKPGLSELLKINFDIINKISNQRIIYENKNINSIRKMILGSFISMGYLL